MIGLCCALLCHLAVLLGSNNGPGKCPVIQEQGAEPNFYSSLPGPGPSLQALRRPAAGAQCISLQSFVMAPKNQNWNHVFSNFQHSPCWIK